MGSQSLTDLYQQYLPLPPSLAQVASDISVNLGDVAAIFKLKAGMSKVTELVFEAAIEALGKSSLEGFEALLARPSTAVALDLIAVRSTVLGEISELQRFLGKMNALTGGDD